MLKHNLGLRLTGIPLDHGRLLRVVHSASYMTLGLELLAGPKEDLSVFAL